jgi:hypothetical protein
MGAIERKSLDSAEDVRSFAKGHLDLVTVGGRTVGRAVFEPGFVWSECIKPIIHADRCELSHQGYVVAGRLAVVGDGALVELQAGDAFCIEPGHESWVVGDEPAVLIDFGGNAGLVAMLEWDGG